MSLRPLAVLSIALGTLSLVACSDTTAPTSQSQIQSAGPSALRCSGGSLLGTGKTC
jgi:hypothetical protein